MADIVLAALNARYSHSAFGLRCLLANLGELRPRAALCEFDIRQRPADIAEDLLALDPQIVGLGVYVWNATLAAELVALLKALRPDLPVVLGGPEVSHETDAQEIVRRADYVLAGEADLAFADLCRRLLAGERPAHKVIAVPPPDPAELALPYDLYTAEDIARRVLYVESSRGCPFACEFCLSALDVPVRRFPLDRLLPALQGLLDRGATAFKFVDRTFNVSVPHARAVLEFFLARLRPGLFVHAEMVPDHLPDELRPVLTAFPRGTLQLEIGVQTFDPEVAARIRRRQDMARTEANLRWLRRETGAYLHADLVAGLPGEDLESFAAGFDRLLALEPHEIQVGILKRLRGAPIARHDAEWGMVYSPHPPYEVLATRVLGFSDLQRLRRFARYWDLFGNSGNFAGSLPRLWAGGASPFACFTAFSDALFRSRGRTHGLALDDLAEALFARLTGEAGLAPTEAAASLAADYRRAGRRDLPAFLVRHGVSLSGPVGSRAPARGRERQSRHLPMATEDTNTNPGGT